MKRRINALKQLQVKCAHIEAKFYEEVHDLERKYAALYQPLFDKVGAARQSRQHVQPSMCQCIADGCPSGPNTWTLRAGYGSVQLAVFS